MTGELRDTGRTRTVPSHVSLVSRPLSAKNLETTNKYTVKTAYTLQSAFIVAFKMHPFIFTRVHVSVGVCARMCADTRRGQRPTLGGGLCILPSILYFEVGVLTEPGLTGQKALGIAPLLGLQVSH